jgi:hypothetical protein
MEEKGEAGGGVYSQSWFHPTLHADSTAYRNWNENKRRQERKNLHSHEHKVVINYVYNSEMLLSKLKLPSQLKVSGSLAVFCAVRFRQSKLPIILRWQLQSLK